MVVLCVVYGIMLVQQRLVQCLNLLHTWLCEMTCSRLQTSHSVQF